MPQTSKNFEAPVVVKHTSNKYKQQEEPVYFLGADEATNNPHFDPNSIEDKDEQAMLEAIEAFKQKCLEMQ
jgi:hypothetical protein